MPIKNATYYIIIKPNFNTNRFRMFSKIKNRNLWRVFEYWTEKFTSAFTLEVLKAQKLFFSHAKAKNFFFIGTTVLQSVFFNESKVYFALQNKVLDWSLLSKFNFRILGKTLNFLTNKGLVLLQVSKSQTHFFLKLHCPKNEQNIR